MEYRGGSLGEFITVGTPGLIKLLASLDKDPTVPLITSKSGLSVGFQSEGVGCPDVSLSTYTGSRTLKSSGDKLVNAPLTTLVLPASSISLHHGPVAPKRVRVCALIDLTFFPYKLSMLAKTVPEAKELLHLDTPYAKWLDCLQESPVLSPGKHLAVAKL